MGDTYSAAQVAEIVGIDRNVRGVLASYGAFKPPYLPPRNEAEDLLHQMEKYPTVFKKEIKDLTKKLPGCPALINHYAPPLKVHRKN